MAYRLCDQTLVPIETEEALTTQCPGEQLEFHALGRRSVTGRFDGGRISSAGGGVLLREVDRRGGVTERVSRCFLDSHNRASIEHDVDDLVNQRIDAMALGYEDLNDPDALFPVLVGKADVTGDKRVRARPRPRPGQCEHPEAPGLR